MSRNFKTNGLVATGLLIFSVIGVVAGQAGDPRNPKSTSTPKNSSPAAKTEAPRKPAATKPDVVKARVIELFNSCKAGRIPNAMSNTAPWEVPQILREG